MGILFIVHLDSIVGTELKPGSKIMKAEKRVDKVTVVRCVKVLSSAPKDVEEVHGLSALFLSPIEPDRSQRTKSLCFLQ